MEISEEQLIQIVEDAAVKAARRVKPTDDEMSRLVEDTVRETLVQFGLDTHQPFEAQRDFMWLRSWRKNTEELKNHSLKVIVGFIVLGIIGLVVTVIKQH